MKAIFDKQELLSAIIPASGSVSQKNTIELLQGISLQCSENGKCTVTAYDLEKGFRKEIEVAVDKGGHYIIDAVQLVQTVRVLPSGFVTIEINDKNIAKIYSGKREFELHALPGDDYPLMPEFDGDIAFSIRSGILKDMIKRTQFAISQDTSRPELCGTYFDIDGETITVVTCDSNRLAKITTVNEYEGHENVKNSFIIPGRTINELLRLLPADDEEQVSVKMTRKHIIFFIDDVIFFSRLIEHSYIDYNRFLPENCITKVYLDKDSFLESLESASLVTEDRTMGQSRSSLRLSFGDSMLRISSSSVFRRVYDEIYTKQEGDNIDIGFNCRFLIDALRGCDSERILIRLRKPREGIIIEDGTEDLEGPSSFKFLVMPVQLNQ
ncbi:MAG: DNA polymerase III subunit beta [Clostridia bacterium]|nr:DNA polymerase III subunit beta [Clostridia bacterium]